MNNVQWKLVGAKIGRSAQKVVVTVYLADYTWKTFHVLS